MVRVLSIHADYRCRDAGVCCRSGWRIPVEDESLSQIAPALSTGVLRPRDGTAFRFVPERSYRTPTMLATDTHACVFYDGDGSHGAHGCRIHRVVGHAALPLACRQFPRVVVRDPRGVSVTLSHYCPTAASLLDIDMPVTIATDAPAFPPDGEYVGLDATQVLPPLLAEGVLMDWDGWWELERLAVDLVGNSRATPRATLRTLGAITERVQSWRPNQDGTLFDHVRRCFETYSAEGHAQPNDRAARRINRFLSAHVFANWDIHSRRGVRAWLDSINEALGLIEHGLDVSAADERLRHRVEPE